MLLMVPVIQTKSRQHALAIFKTTCVVFVYQSDINFLKNPHEDLLGNMT